MVAWPQMFPTDITLAAPIGRQFHSSDRQNSSHRPIVGDRNRLPILEFGDDADHPAPGSAPCRPLASAADVLALRKASAILRSFRSSFSGTPHKQENA
jgi:hypothetical protein